MTKPVNISEQTELSISDVVAFVESSNRVIDSQQKTIAGLQKTASEHKSKVLELATMLQAEKQKNSALAKQAQEKETVSPPTGWGKGENREIPKTIVKKSEQILLDRFGPK